MRPVIQVEHLSKHYRLGLIGGGTLREDLHRWWAKARGRPDPLLKIGQEDHGNREGGELWALRDVSFQVQEGEILGIIGRNGAGKSTLLKILSRITAPTTGQVKIRGRVGSLLEVGTGFHPELTGRENIYLNGAILGMKKAEIDRKLDEIIDFAEIEQFIDTPVKRYSSGMYVRLAFAVAAHLEPEILVVDEVLAVGDAAFQSKCLGKMETISELDGRTILFVSHNLAAVGNLCTKGMVIAAGTTQFTGNTSDAITFYLAQQQKYKHGITLREREDREGAHNIRMVDMWVEIENLQKSKSMKAGEDMAIVIQYESNAEIKNPRIVIGIYDLMNVPVARLDTNITRGLPRQWQGNGKIICHVEKLSLCPAAYYANVAIYNNGELEDYLVRAIDFEILSSDFFGTGKFFSDSELRLAKALYRHSWSVN